jgi:hypothetical protein
MTGYLMLIPFVLKLTQQRYEEFLSCLVDVNVYCIWICEDLLQTDAVSARHSIVTALRHCRSKFSTRHALGLRWLLQYLLGYPLYAASIATSSILP